MENKQITLTQDEIDKLLEYAVETLQIEQHRLLDKIRRHEHNLPEHYIDVDKERKSLYSINKALIMLNPN